MYQNPNFDKKEYRKNREAGNPGVPKPVTRKAMPDPNSGVEIGFDTNGKLVPKTRAWKRTHIRLRLTKKYMGIPPRKLADYRKKQAARKRREARELKKEKANA